MGVRGLWKILEPTAQPVQLESLRGKVLAIDASIWIYHFLKAMRDTKGTVLAAAHIIGFFRRICKLLFYEIKPVFVFDGSPPILKKETTSKRNDRRITREQSARNTANKLLTIQLQRAHQQKNAAKEPLRENYEYEVLGDVPDNAVYFDDLTNEPNAPSSANSTSHSSAPSTSNKPFVKSDQYHLPELGQIAPIRADDQRLLTQDELDEYAKQFTSQARGGFIDTSLVDFHSKEFGRLPIETQYQLLNMARMKSRLRMGYTSEELNKMFPNEMEFSKFQINRVTQRNFFTQKLMNLVGLEEDLTRRVSSEKDKEYFLKRTEQGWSLSLEGAQTNQEVKHEIKQEDGEPKSHDAYGGDSSEDDFEDVDLDPLDKEQAGSPLEQSINLTAEESAKIDELFGFEAQITRQNLYDKLMNEVRAEEDEESEASNQSIKSSSSKELKNKELVSREVDKVSDKVSPQPIKSMRSLLFGDAEAEQDEPSEEISSKERHEKQPAVPWFENNNEDFHDMEISRLTDPNFVDLNNLSDSESKSEYENDDTEELLTDPERQDKLKRATNYSTHISSNEPVEEVQDYKDVTTRTLGQDEKGLESHVALEQTNREPKETSLEKVETKVDGLTEDLASTPERQVQDQQSMGRLTRPLAVPETSNNLVGELQESESIPVPSAETVERAEEEARDDEEENENIAGMLVAEAEENERFAKALAQNSHQAWTDADEKDYEEQISLLRKQFAKNTRDADNISNDMVQECQELLQLFGIPYITAPAEAEAQCAELRSLNLVDGIVTDDGDTFLFDDDAVVYRNMFSQAKFVEFYSTKQIRKNLGLDRHKLIDLAFLLGSDYTEGILGIGPVTGVEIIAEFGDLKSFAHWWNMAQRFPDDADVSTSLRRRLLKQFKSKLFLPEDFPREAVVQAYMNPSVDKDRSQFTWGIPDLDNIRKMLALTAGWNADKVNAVVLPVVQEAKRSELRRKTLKSYDQSHIGDYYSSIVQNPEMGSKRTHQAVQSLRKRAKKTE